MDSPPPDSHAAPQPGINIEAEQALLGTILLDNNCIGDVLSVINAQCFYDPVHRRIFTKAHDLIRDNQPANAVTLKTFFADDEGLTQLGGNAYLAKLTGQAVSRNVTDYARVVRDCYGIRMAAKIGKTLATGPDATDGSVQGWIIPFADQLMNLTHESETNAAQKTLSAEEALDLFLSDDAEARKIKWGIPELDNIIGGFAGGQTYVIGGETSHGKTSIMVSMASAFAQQGKRTLYLSLEMYAQEIMERVVSMVWNKPYKDLGRLKNEAKKVHTLMHGDPHTGEMGLKQVADLIKPLPFYVGAVSRMSLSRIESEVRKFQPDAVFLDYLQIVTPPKDALGRVNQLEAISATLKTIAMVHNIPVIIGSQFSRQTSQNDTPRPRLNWLKGAGAIEQDSTASLLLFWPFKADVTKDGDGGLLTAEDYEIGVAKNRKGSDGLAKIKCDMPTNRFWSPSLATNPIPHSVILPPSDVGRLEDSALPLD